MPFVLNVSCLTFEKLHLLLKIVCDGLEGDKEIYPSPPNQEQECMAVATLNLLKLQVLTYSNFHQLSLIILHAYELVTVLNGVLNIKVHIIHCFYILQILFFTICIYTYIYIYIQLYAATSMLIDPESIGLHPGSALLHSIKHIIVKLAVGSGVLASVQNAAQSVLRSGWTLLLPTVSERASALSGLLPSGEGKNV